MKTLLSSILLACGLIFAGCSTTNSRISKNQALFDSYPVATQSTIRAGEVAVGFTPEQVRMSLGDPDREATIETEAGKQIVWQYFKSKPGVGLSLGVGTMIGGGSSVGTGVGVSSGSGNKHLEKSIVFDRKTGKVSQVESYE